MCQTVSLSGGHTHTLFALYLCAIPDWESLTNWMPSCKKRTTFANGLALTEHSISISSPSLTVNALMACPLYKRLTFGTSDEQLLIFFGRKQRETEKRYNSLKVLIKVTKIKVDFIFK